MRVMLCSIKESDFEKCVTHKLWGANSTNVTSWNKGDLLFFKIGNLLSAVAKVSGEAYMDDTPIWENGLFFYRVEITFLKILENSERIPFEGKIKDAFLNQWGKNYGWVIQNKYAMPEHISDQLLNLFEIK